MSIFRSVSDVVVNAMGYAPLKKAEVSRGYRSIAMNPRNGIYLDSREIQRLGLRKPGLSFKILKHISNRDALIRICINVIKKAVSQAEWEIRVKEEAPKSKEHYEEKKDEIYDLFEYMNMNGENNRVLLDRVIEDILVLDAGCIEKVYSLDGKNLMALNSVDGGTIRPVYNIYGELGDPAYKQVIDRKVTAEFKQDEMVYIMANPQNDIDYFGYGKSTIESIMLQVQASLEADMYNIKQFTRNNVPPGMLDLGSMSTPEAESFIEQWEDKVEQNVQAMRFVWGSENSKKWIPFNSGNKDMQYSEYVDWLSRVKLAAFGLSSLDANMLQDVNRATAEVQQQISQSRGVQSMKKLISEYYTRQIIREMGPDDEDYKYLEFCFPGVETLDDKLKQSEIDQIDITSQIVSPNEVREKRGMQPKEDTMEFNEELDAEIQGAIAADQKLKEKELEGKATKSLYE